jgi:CelD/BcsL family acetyltransferase involved in cellulose biosynthesis
MKSHGLYSFSELPKLEKIYRIQMVPSYDEWLKSLPRKRRQNLSWQVRKFNRSVEGPVTLWAVNSEENVCSYLDMLNRLYPVTWQAKNFGKWKRNRINEIEYFTSVAQTGSLRAYMLMDGNRAVAFLIGFQYAGTYYYEEIGYDPDYSHLGPGNVLNTLFIEDLYKTETPMLLDFGFGENTYKKVLSNLEVDADRLSLVKDKKWLLLNLGQRILLLFYSWVREMIKGFRVERWLKNIIKNR